MSGVTDGGFPRRDAQRRIVALPDLVGITLAGAVAGAVALVVLDGAFALLGLGDFGRVNGWLAVILPVMLLVEEFRAWRGTRARIAVALVAAVLAVGTGLVIAGLADGLPNLAAGMIGAITFTLVYALLWFYGIRAAGGRAGEDVP
jgi:hypothetical protein